MDVRGRDIPRLLSTVYRLRQTITVAAALCFLFHFLFFDMLSLPSPAYPLIDYIVINMTN
jgi:hypothetical protein